jgi:hypothetical protein
MTRIRRTIAFVSIAVTLVLGLIPFSALWAANPHLAGDTVPCVYSGKSGATGNGEISHPFSQTAGDPNCSVVTLDFAKDTTRRVR